MMPEFQPHLGSAGGQLLESPKEGNRAAGKKGISLEAKNESPDAVIGKAEEQSEGDDGIG